MHRHNRISSKELKPKCRRDFKKIYLNGKKTIKLNLSTNLERS